MKFDKFKVNNRDIIKVSELIYESNKNILKYAFGTSKKAPKRLEKLVRIGKNHYGYDNIYVAYDGEKIAGLFVGYTGKDQEDRHKETDSITFFKLMRAYGYLKYKLYVRPLFMRISLVDMKSDDFYMGDVVIVDEYVGKDLENFLLKNAIIVAKSKKCRRIVMDLSLEKTKEKKFFKQFGFKEYDKKTEHIKNDTFGNYFMEYSL
jgi:hypothetical protein